MNNSLNDVFSSDGTPSPWRTRGSYDPNFSANASAGNLPLQQNCTIGPSATIVPGDSFIALASFTYAAIGGGPLTINAGDRIVYTGGTLTAAASWTIIAMHFPASARIIAQIDPAFLI